jgi:hypothetical protein
MKLEEIISNYGVPDPKLVGKLPRGGMSLDFVGHADVTKMLIEVDPEWSWEPVAFDTDGLPAYRVENGMAHMAGWLTIHGVRRLGIGSVMHNKPDLLKELFLPFLRLLALLRNFAGVILSRDLIGQFRLSVICFSLNYCNGTFWQRTNCNLGLAILWLEESLRIPVQHADYVVFPLNLPSRPSSSTGRRKYGFVED